MITDEELRARCDHLARLLHRGAWLAWLAVTVTILAILLAGCAPPPGTAAPSSRASSAVPPPPSSPAGLGQVHDPGQVTGTIAGPCRARDGGQLPDPHCTPGSIDPAVNQEHIHATICMTGYTRSVRPPAAQTDAFKRAAYAAYGIPAGTASELDHEVPLELGGSNDASNLWPEIGKIPNSKDSVENILHTAVCSGRVTLAAARDAIASDWLTAEQVLGLAGP